MLDELSNVVDGFNSQKTIVIDAGIATQDNLEIIKRKQFKYLAVSRKKSYRDDFWQGSKEQQIKLSDKKTWLKVKLVRTKKEPYLLCHSQAKEAKEKAILERRLQKFAEGLQEINNGLKKIRTHKRYDKIIERIGRLKEKYGVGSLYDIEVKQAKRRSPPKLFSDKNPNGKAKEKDTFLLLGRASLDYVLLPFLVKDDDGVRAASQRFGQLTGIIVTDVSGRRTDQA